ncbi:MAG TPA: HEAT repeat domain-containing protein [Planctomycetota bacterium]|nr:HEAT repeat domain-containing protein [Planctomycetota bacterium]
MAEMSWLMVLMTALSQGAGNDLLDYADGLTYWQQQGVEQTVEALTEQLKAEPQGEESAQAASVRRLLAIRTLGELKDRRALAALTALTNDRDPFVAEYARQAIATIEGKPFARPRPTDAAMESDVALLPAGCATVVQMRLPTGSHVSYDKVFEAMGDAAKDLDRKTVLRELTGTILDLAARTGNIRIDGVTVGLAGDVGDDTGFVVIVGRGRYDAAAVRAMLKDLCEDVRTVGNLEVFPPDDGVAILCPSDDRFVFIAGPNADVLPISKVVAALGGKGGGVLDDAEMTRLMRSVDRTQPVWAVAKVTETYRQAPLLAPFNTLTLVGEQTDDAIRLKLTARGDDPQKIREQVKVFEDDRAEALKEMKKEAGEMPFMKDLIAGVEGMKTQVTGNEATVTATFKGKLGLLLPLIMGSVHSEAREVPVE